jgi:hypothetical protein
MRKLITSVAIAAIIAVAGIGATSAPAFADHGKKHHHGKHHHHKHHHHKHHGHYNGVYWGLGGLATGLALGYAYNSYSQPQVQYVPAPAPVYPAAPAYTYDPYTGQYYQAAPAYYYAPAPTIVP